MAESSIHPTAIVDHAVSLGERVTIGPFARIEGDVRIGDDCWIATGAVIGALPEIRPLSFADLPSAKGVTIGSRTTVREYAQVHQGWTTRTVVGDECLIMNQCYVAHDCIVGDGVVLASSTLLAGHVRIGPGANLGMGSSVHQRRVIGAGAMIGMGAAVVRDIPAWTTAVGVPARVIGVNSVGLQRAGLRTESISAIESAARSGRTAEMRALIRESGVLI